MYSTISSKPFTFIFCYTDRWLWWDQHRRRSQLGVWAGLFPRGCNSWNVDWWGETAARCSYWRSCTGIIFSILAHLFPFSRKSSHSSARRPFANRVDGRIVRIWRAFNPRGCGQQSVIVVENHDVYHTVANVQRASWTNGDAQWVVANSDQRHSCNHQVWAIQSTYVTWWHCRQLVCSVVIHNGRASNSCKHLVDPLPLLVSYRSTVSSRMVRQCQHSC